MKRKPLTASELMARLNADPDYVARIRARDEAIERRAEEHTRAEAPLVQELRDAGFAVNSAWDFVNTSDPYLRALPILADHLPRPYPDAVREGIARALAVRDAKFAWPMLVKAYRQEHGRQAKDGLAVAIANVADREVIDELIALARDPQHGGSRILLLSALERLRLPHARKVLMELGGDPDLHKEVQVVLRRLNRGKRLFGVKRAGKLGSNTLGSK